LGRVPAPCG